MSQKFYCTPPFYPDNDAVQLAEFARSPWMWKGLYVVWQGFKPGVYTSWASTHPMVDGYPGAGFKGCKTYAEALDKWNANCGRSHHYPDGSHCVHWIGQTHQIRTATIENALQPPDPRPQHISTAPTSPASTVSDESSIATTASSSGNTRVLLSSEPSFHAARSGKRLFYYTIPGNGSVYGTRAGVKGALQQLAARGHQAAEIEVYSNFEQAVNDATWGEPGAYFVISGSTKVVTELKTAELELILAVNNEVEGPEVRIFDKDELDAALEFIESQTL